MNCEEEELDAMQLEYELREEYRTAKLGETDRDLFGSTDDSFEYMKAITKAYMKTFNGVNL